jgi:hypothetical protein
MRQSDAEAESEPRIRFAKSGVPLVRRIPEPALALRARSRYQDNCSDQWRSR